MSENVYLSFDYSNQTRDIFARLAIQRADLYQIINNNNKSLKYNSSIDGCMSKCVRVLLTSQ